MDMNFLLVNEYIKFPLYLTKDGTGLLEKPESEIVCQRLGIIETSLPSDDVISAVEGKYFERYNEAKEYLDSVIESLKNK